MAMKNIILCIIALLSLNAFSADSLVECTYLLKSANADSNYWGTAVAVDVSNYGFKGKRYLLTAAHNIKKTTDTETLIQMEVGWIKCKCVKIDEDFDVCLLECALDSPTVATLDSTVDLPVGTVLENVGCPKSNKPEKVVSGKLEEKHMNWKAPFPGFYHGSSGSPVFHNGKLFGIGTGGEADKKGEMIEGIGFFLPLRRLQQFLTE